MVVFHSYLKLPEGNVVFICSTCLNRLEWYVEMAGRVKENKVNLPRGNLKYQWAYFQDAAYLSVDSNLDSESFNVSIYIYIYIIYIYVYIICILIFISTYITYIYIYTYNI